jgi:rare lipoprotein A (peptidoglycan hydrolase)
MKAGRDRHGRHDNPRLGGANSERSRNRVRWAVLLSATVATVALAAGPAQATTGGISSVAFGGAASASGQDIAFSPMRVAGATWYGPGLYGNRTACGQTLRPSTIGVAHRKLPCGTTVKFAYHGRYLITSVIDRGPYTGGHAWDLTNGARKMLDFDGSNRVRYAIARNFARP